MYVGLELATGGDLFDKIEPDVGLEEDLAHLYFKQLINAVDFVHSKGVAHRDIKPENILLDDKGNLKLADFGLATVFRRKGGSKRVCTTPCGSPPYVAPEIVSPKGYDPELADVWSCGVVLFVIACGQIPWEEPTTKDADFEDFLSKDGRVTSDGWNRMPFELLAFLRFVLKTSVEHRPDINRIRQHVWVNRSNGLSTDEGLVKDTVSLTARLLGRLHIGLTDEQFEEDQSSQTRYDSIQDHFTTSQPVTDIAAMINDEEEDVLKGLPATQQVFTEHSRYLLDEKVSSERQTIIDIISKDPAALQFSKNRQVDLSSLDLSNAGRLTRFFSILPIETLLPILTSSLNRVGVSTSFQDCHFSESSLAQKAVHISVHTTDCKKMVLRGQIKVSRVQNLSLKQVEFKKTRGDPLEWRRFFKRIAVLSREAVYTE
jgi:serine/threonine-protein kinase Chk1